MSDAPKRRVRENVGYCRPPILYGLDHHAARPTVTPAGLFESLSAAAAHYGINRCTAWFRVRQGNDGFKVGWHYL